MTHLIDSGQRSLGVTFPSEHEARIQVWAPLANYVAIKIYGHPAGRKAA